MKLAQITFGLNHPRALGFAAVTFVLGAGLSFALRTKIAESEIYATQQKVDLESHQINETLVALLGKRMKALQRFANVWSLRDGMDPEQWEHVTGGFMADMPDLVGLDWADAHGVIRRVSPAKYQKLMAGLDLSTDPERAATYAEAQAAKVMAATPLIHLKRGGVGFNVVVPLVGRSKGFILGVYDLVPLLEEMNHAGYHLHLRDLRGDLSVESPAAGDTAPEFTKMVNITSTLHQWEIEVVPLRSTIRSAHGPFSRLVLVFGLLISTFAAGLVYLLGAWQRGNQELRRALGQIDVYRVALDKATMVTIRSPDGFIIYANDLFSETMGFTPAEMIGQHQRMFDDPAHPATLTPADWANLRAGQVWKGDMRHRRKDGSTIYVDKTIVPCLDEKGVLYQFITIQRDVTARTEMMHEFRHMIENMPGGAILINENGFFANREIETLTGYSRDDLKTVNDWFRLVHREQAEECMRSYEADNRRDYRGSRVVPIVTAGGAVRTLNIYTYRDHSTEIWLLHDVTETLAAQERFRMVFEHSTDGQMIVDYADGRCIILEANPALARMLGVADKANLIGRSSNEFSAPYDQSATNTPELFDARMAQANHRPNEFEWDRVRHDGTVFPVRSTTSPVQIDGRTVILSTWHDLTAEKEVQAKLVHSSKMQSLGEMSGGLSHELNTPLATIKAKVQHLSMLAQGGQLPPRTLSDGLAKIELTADRMSRIVSGLRHFAQDTEGEPMSPENVMTLVHDALAFCRARMTLLDVTLNLNIDQDVQINCRPWQITQAILNLLNNALDAVQDRDEKWIEIFVNVDQGGLQIHVIDSGAGIAPAVRERMMQPFFTTKPVGQGTGLGLSVSRGIIESHGGELDFDPAAANTAFVIRLPMTG